MGIKVLIKATVAEIVAETTAIKRFVLRPAKRPAFPAFEPGDHAFLVLPNGMRRPYSICSDPADPSRWDFAVLREEDGLGGSACLHDTVAAGDTLLVTHPQRGLGLVPDATRHVFVAGGIGITPFVAMALRLARDGGAFELNYCARAPGEAAFAGRLRSIAGPDAFTTWFGPGQGGRLDLAHRFAAPQPGTHVYCCGPSRMIDAFLEATALWPADQVHVEHFIGLSKAQAQHGDAFEVELTSGETLAVPADRSLLQVLRDAGHPIDSSCEGGACGSCRVTFTAGEPLHRDFCLRPEERHDTLIACVSRAKGRLVLAV